MLQGRGTLWTMGGRNTTSLQSGIPSPSNMKWEDVPLVLVGSIPFFTNVDLPTCTETETTELTSIYNFTDKLVSRILEADASSRVLILLLQVFKNFPSEKTNVILYSVSTNCSPFTDYLIKITGIKSMIIEVKKFSISHYKSMKLPRF